MRGCEHLVSNQVLQKTIDELRAITRIDLCVMSLEGQKVASTFSEEGFEPEYVREFVKSPADSQVLQGYHFFKIYDDQNVEYVLVTKRRKRRCIYDRKDRRMRDPESDRCLQRASG